MIEKFLEEIQDASLAISDRFVDFPKVAIVLGSGMGEFVDRLANPQILPYALIPHFPKTTVVGHHGNLVVGEVSGIRVVVFQGRFHYYEGHELTTVTFPVRVMKSLGVQTLILTAATGGIREDLRPGDVLALSDHLNLIGSNPLRGPNFEAFGPRFPDMSEVYSAKLRGKAKTVALSINLDLKEGVYACFSGPSYETPAEIRLLRTLGADVVGMSTVPEAIVARHCGIEVLAFAIVSNAAAGISSASITHEEVLAAGAEAGPRLGRLIEGVIAAL